jgi:hypothetical protein
MVPTGARVVNSAIIWQFRSMERTMLKTTAIFVGVAVSGWISMALVSTGTAAADTAADLREEIIGKTYSAAKGLVGAKGYTSEVVTTAGDRLSQDECRVVSASQKPGGSEGNVMQVNLNCYPSGGYSAGNNAPDAEKVRDAEAQENLAWKQTAGGQKWCQEAAVEHPEWVPISGCPEWQQTADGEEWCQEAQTEHPEWCRPPQNAGSTSAPIHIYVDGAA